MTTSTVAERLQFCIGLKRLSNVFAESGVVPLGIKAFVDFAFKKSGRKLDRAIEVHTVELKKSRFDKTTISGANRLSQWCWLILNAHEYSAEELRRMFPALEFQPVIGCLETISSKTIVTVLSRCLSFFPKVRALSSTNWRFEWRNANR